MTQKQSKRILSVTIRHLVDENPDYSYLEQKGLGFEERLEQFRNGQFGFMGVLAEADVQLGENSVIQTITSGGLWGIEDDSDADFIRSVDREELAGLKDELRKLGFSTRAISKAFENAEVK